MNHPAKKIVKDAAYYRRYRREHRDVINARKRAYRKAGQS